MPSAPIWLSRVSARLMSAMPVSASSSSLRVCGGHERQQQPLVFDEEVVELPDEAPSQLLFVGLLVDDSVPRAAEVVDEFGERQDQGFAEQPCLRAEVAEQQMLGNACGFGDFTRRRAAVVLAGEQVTGGGEQKLPRGAPRPARTLGWGLGLGRQFCGRALGHGCTLLKPRLVVDCL